MRPITTDSSWTTRIAPHRDHRSGSDSLIRLEFFFECMACTILFFRMHASHCSSPEWSFFFSSTLILNHALAQVITSSTLIFLKNIVPFVDTIVICALIIPIVCKCYYFNIHVASLPRSNSIHGKFCIRIRRTFFSCHAGLRLTWAAQLTVSDDKSCDIKRNKNTIGWAFHTSCSMCTISPCYFFDCQLKLPE